jgi:hypothetical protein
MATKNKSGVSDRRSGGMKNALASLLVMAFIGLSAVASLEAARALVRVAQIQVLHDLLSADSQP